MVSLLSLILSVAFCQNPSTPSVRSDDLELQSLRLSVNKFEMGRGTYTSSPSYLNGANFAVDSGNVGIGTSSPTFKLDVTGGNAIISTVTVPGSISARILTITSTATIQGNAFSVGTSTLVVVTGEVRVGQTADGVAKLYVESTNTTRRLLGLYSATQENYAGIAFLIDVERVGATAYEFARFRSDVDGTVDTEFLFRGDGVGFSDGGWTTPADYAEFFKSNDKTLKNDKGCLVCISTPGVVERCDSGKIPIGIVSTRPGIMGVYAGDVTSSFPKMEKDNLWVMVALLGQVPTKVDVSRGIIVPGDELSVGANGLAIKGPSPKTLRMIALEGASRPGKIRVLIK